jgi:hypothetical protein
MSSCLIAPCPIQIGWIWTCFSQFFVSKILYILLFKPIHTISSHFKPFQATSSHFKPLQSLWIIRVFGDGDQDSGVFIGTHYMYIASNECSSNILVRYSYFAIIRRRLVSYEVLPPLKISGIAWELRCLNESSVARHQPELWARGIHMEGYLVHWFLWWTSWCYNYRTSITTISIWPFQASGPSRGPRGMSSCLIAPCPIQIGWIWTCFSPFFGF